jgi:hypothetical protein
MLLSSNGDLRSEIAYEIIAAVSLINLLATLITLYLIYFMRRNGTIRSINLYLKCVLLMTFYEAISVYFTLIFMTKCGGINAVHSGTFAGAMVPQGNISTVCAIGGAGLVIGGYGSALWSLVLILAAYFTVEMGRKPSRGEEVTAFIVGKFRVDRRVHSHIVLSGFRYAHPAILTIPPIHASVSIFQYIQVFFIAPASYISNVRPQPLLKQVYIYTYGRLVLIGLSVVVVCQMYWSLLFKVTAAKDRARNPMYHLLRKIVFYPLAQSFCQFVVTAYYWEYSLVDFSGRHGFWQAFWCYVGAITMQLAGVADFLIFLSIQGGAKAELKRLVCSSFSICGTTNDTSEVDEQDGRASLPEHEMKKRKFNTGKDLLRGGMSTMEEDGDGDSDEDGEEGTKAVNRGEGDDQFDADDAAVQNYEFMNEEELLMEHIQSTFINRPTFVKRIGASIASRFSQISNSFGTSSTDSSISSNSKDHIPSPTGPIIPHHISRPGSSSDHL